MVRPGRQGTFGRFVYDADPAFRKMLYRIAFRDGAGRRLTLEGEKRVPGRPSSVRGATRRRFTCESCAIRAMASRS